MTLKLSDIKAGDVIVMDDSFETVQADIHVVGNLHGDQFVIDGNGEPVFLQSDAFGNAIGVLRKVPGDLPKTSSASHYS